MPIFERIWIIYHLQYPYFSKQKKVIKVHKIGIYPIYPFECPHFFEIPNIYPLIYY